jgi:5'-methylthioadenosine phosphorylase
LEKLKIAIIDETGFEELFKQGQQLRFGTPYGIAPPLSDARVAHVDVSQPYCPEIRGALIETARKLDVKLRDRTVLVCTEGPRFETPTEIQMFRVLGCDVIGMTNLPEAILTRELGMCRAALCFVSNMAAGMQERLTPFDVSKVSVQIMPKLQQLLIGAVKALPLQLEGNCSCADA